MIKAILKNRWLQKFINLFKQGLTPKELAMSVTIAVLLGVIPVLGVSTGLIAFSALRFHLNAALMIAVSYIVYPFQFALFVPYLKLGEWFFDVEDSGLTMDKMKEAFSNSILGALSDLWTANLFAFGSWLITSVPIGFVIFGTLFQVFKVVIKPKTASI